MAGNHLLAAARHIELNPERDKLAKRPGDYKWSSCEARLTGKDDKLVKVEPLLKLVRNRTDFIREPVSEIELENMRRHERAGIPLGDVSFVDKLESETGRYLRKKKPRAQRTSKEGIIN